MENSSTLSYFPWLSFNKLPTEHSRIIGYSIIGYEHNLLGNGGYPLSLNPSKVPPTQYQPKALVAPLSTCPHRDCGGPILQQESLSIGSDTVWSVYHRTSNTWDSIRLWREIVRAERRPRWQIRIQSGTVSRAVMEEMFTRWGREWRQGQGWEGQDEGHTRREEELHTVRIRAHVRKILIECELS